MIISSVTEGKSFYIKKTVSLHLENSPHPVKGSCESPLLGLFTKFFTGLMLIVKSRKTLFFFITTKAGIQFFQKLITELDPGFAWVTTIY